ncbi:MAG: ADP-ribosylglycohydrolase family protein [Clostridia bacterium]
MQNYQQQLYAGILGKMIGVYFGRPVEGWSYAHIRKVFGTITDYVNAQTGAPLHVPDDDLSGTFTFIRTLEDAADLEHVPDAAFGQAWLDYVIENQTIFWWGGFGRSTEHTAFLRLKQGMSAPQSGSIATNGQAVAEQIGAQIFMDAFAMLCPNDPTKARELVRAAASVSHDGIAVEAACFLATLEALAFSICDVKALLDCAIKNAEWSPQLLALIAEVRCECAEQREWRGVRAWLDQAYGYERYPGNCHVIPNFALILCALLLGGDDFSAAMQIVVSSGWDTDCNGANLGCLNGIRLGLGAINQAFDYRTPIADRFYCISSLGSECVTDAVQQTRRLLALHARLYHHPVPPRQPRFGFELPGAVQGFTHCPVVEGSTCAVYNANEQGGANGLILKAHLQDQALSTLTAWDPADVYGGYALVGSPTLYGGQTLQCTVTALVGKPVVRLYVIAADAQNQPLVFWGEQTAVIRQQTISWKIPPEAALSVVRVGLQLCGQAEQSEICLNAMDWQGAPSCIELQGVLRNEETGAPVMPFYAFTSSAKQFQPDKRYTLCLSHPEKRGIADVGSAEWEHYCLSAKVVPSMCSEFGLVVRTRGHRRYNALLFSADGFVRLVVREGEKEIVLDEKAYAKSWLEEPMCLSLCCVKDELIATIDGQVTLSARDGRFAGGGAGFAVSEGTLMVEWMKIEAVQAKEEDIPERNGLCMNG